MGILAVNGGSSSLKCAYFANDGGEPVEKATFVFSDVFTQPNFRVSTDNQPVAVEAMSINPDVDSHIFCLNYVFHWLRNHDYEEITAIGHRVVHGGMHYSNPVLIDQNVIADLRKLIPLAPLHQPVSLKLIEAVTCSLPGIPQVACFDTMFHRTQPSVAQVFAIPRSLTQMGLRSYGFHGLSYEYVLDTVIKLDLNAAHEKLLLAHLGAGASLCAVQDGCSVATTMGFSPADGVPMATRTGRIDPGILIYLLRQGMQVEQLEDLIYRQSGLLGMSGISGSMQTLRQSHATEAQEAIEFFVYRVVCEIGGLVAAMGGMDRLVFTGGIGENDSEMRRSIVAKCEWLGLGLKDDANQRHSTHIHSDNSTAKMHVIATDEEAMIAKHTMGILSSPNE